MKKYLIFLMIFLLTIGFASVSATFILNGKTSVAYDKNNLQVIFTRVRLNNEESENIIISEDGTSFVYIADDLVNIGDTSSIEYDIKNGSSNYDASVVVSCSTDYPDNIEYTGNTLNQVIDIQAGEGYTDSLTTNLIKENTSSNSLSLKCSLITDPTSRDTIMLGREYNLTFDSNGGSIIDAPTIVNYYEKYGELPIPTKANNEFLGWYTEDGEKIDSTSLVKVKDNHTLIAKWKETCPYEVGKTWNLDYTGSEQTFTVPCDGKYKIELWGASGGTANSTYSIGGSGGYTSGYLTIKNKLELYLYIGESGKLYTESWNGGGLVRTLDYLYGYPYYRTSGGGATDIRLSSSSEKKWNDFESLKSRIMVAGGGGGTGYFYDGRYFYGNGGGAGGLVAYKGTNTSAREGGYGGTGGTQITPGKADVTGSIDSMYIGGFGYGAGSSDNASGGGSGYYGGGSGNKSFMGGAGGGSSFISGHDGCDAIDESSTSSNIIHTGQPNHYSKYVFTETKMIDGAGYAWTTVKESKEQMPNPSGGYYDLGIGHSGNGHARITLVSID